MLRVLAWSQHLWKSFLFVKSQFSYCKIVIPLCCLPAHSMWNVLLAINLVSPTARKRLWLIAEPSGRWEQTSWNSQTSKEAGCLDNKNLKHEHKETKIWVCLLNLLWGPGKKNGRKALFYDLYVVSKSGMWMRHLRLKKCLECLERADRCTGV